MAMLGADLATSIRVAMAFPEPNSEQMLGWGNAIVQHVQTGSVDNASGTVTGTVPPNGGPLQDGAATNGIISGLSGSTLASLVASEAGYPSVSAELSTICEEIVFHIQGFALVEFAAGSITGTCTNTTTTAGTFTGTGSGGTLSGMNGGGLANAIHTAVGYPGSVSAKLTQFCSAIVNYIEANAEVSYSTVTGTCSAGGGSLIGGTASNGTIA